MGADDAAQGVIVGFLKRDGAAEAIVRFELGIAPETAAEEPPETVGDESGERTGVDVPSQFMYERYAPPAATAPDEPPAKPTPDESVADDPEVSGESRTAAPPEPGAIAVNNMTSYSIDIPSLLDEPITAASADGGPPRVLILHTHGSEAYTPEGDDAYEPSDPYRTEDSSRNIIRVGDELEARLRERGLPVIHDTGVYDFPSYQGSYGRTDAVVASYMERYPDIGLIIDMHRDAISAPDGSQYKTVAHIGDNVCSQIMFFVGTDAAGLNHPGWRENLKLALRVQNEMNALYPSLARPIYLSQYRYNQHRSIGSLLVEVGSAGNTLAESLDAVRYFADAYANVVMSMY
jgi:stage II sporulation protein P